MSYIVGVLVITGILEAQNDMSWDIEEVLRKWFNVISIANNSFNP
jgi:hypothetical protein